MFEQLCHFIAKSYGQPDTRFVVLQGAIDTFSKEQVEEIAQEYIVDKVIEALTKENSGGQ